ncbi:MAG: phage tail protein I [Hyphomicrobium sp.]
MTDLPVITTRAEHLLPYDGGDATPLEVALSASDARMLQAPTHIIRAAWNPDTCPAHLLPYLAAAWSVDHWNPAWPDAVKRDVIRRAPEVHRLKGTRRAMRRALEALGLKASITEWWQQTPIGQPYTFKIRVLAVERLFGGGELLTDTLQRDALAIVKAVKPVSRWFSFEVGVGTTAAIQVAARQRALQLTRPVAHARPVTIVGRTVGIAARGRALAMTVAAASAEPIRTAGVRIVAAARMRALQIHSFRMEAVAS